MEYITIGHIANTHGLKGEVKVKPQTHFASERFAKGANVFVKIQENYQPLTVVSMREHKGMLLVCFAGYEDINQVEGWKGCSLYIQEDQLGALEEDEIYYRDLMKMDVKCMDGTLLGKVTQIIETGANVVIRVQGEKEVLIPYVRNFIKEVDREQNTLYVELLDGML